MIDSIRKAIEKGYQICITGVRRGRVRTPDRKVYEISNGQCTCAAGVVGTRCKHVLWIDFLTSQQETKLKVGEVEWSE